MSLFRGIADRSERFARSGRDELEASRRLKAAHPTCQHCKKKPTAIVMGRPVDGKHCFCRDCGELAGTLLQAARAPGGVQAGAPADAGAARRARALSMLDSVGRN